MQAFQVKPPSAARGFSGKPAPTEPSYSNWISQGQSMFVHSESGGCDSQGQFPSEGPQPQFQLHHASNSSRCSSSVIENSSSSPNFARSFSLITTSHEDVEALEKQFAARVSGVEDTARCGESRQSGSVKWRLSYSSASVVARFSAQQLNLTAASKPKVNRSFLPSRDRCCLC